LAAAENDWKRTQRLKHTTTQTEYDHALAGFDVAQADLAANQARLEQAYVAERLARINLDYTVIRSPIDGLVIDRRVDVGQTVVSGLNTPSLFLLASDLARMRIRAAVNEADISKVRLGQKVYFSVDAYPEQRLAGVVAQVRLNASITNNVVTYDVVIDIDNPNGQLLPYMTASLRFVIDERQGVFKAPAEALHWQPEGEVPAPVISGAATRSLWHLEAGMARPIEITPGLTDGAFIEVQGDGLRPGLSLIVGRQQRSAADFGSTILKSILGG
jgi:HlyD family secretion protein